MRMCHVLMITSCRTKYFNLNLKSMYISKLYKICICVAGLYNMWLFSVNNFLICDTTD